MTSSDVLFVTSGLGVGGAESSLLRLITGLERRGVRCSVVSLSGDGAHGIHLRKIGVPLETVDAHHHPVRAVAQLVDAARRKPALVQGWMYRGNICASLVGWIAGPTTRVVWGVRHSITTLDDERRGTRAVIRASGWLPWAPDLVVYNSLAGAQSHTGLGYARWPGRVIANGVDPTQYRPDQTARAELRRAAGWGADTVVVGCVARFHEMKDIPTFLAAARLLLQRMPELRFVLIGRGMTDSNSRLAAMLSGMADGERAMLLGEQKHMERVFPALDLLVQSSRFGEGFPNVLIEAMACAVPCVATDVGDAAAILGDARLIAPPGDHKALARACEQVLAQSLQARAALGAECRRRVIQCFSVDAMVSAYEALYRDLTSGGARDA